MQVWIYPEREWRELGEERWEVEWQTVKAKALARVQAAEARGEYDEINVDSDLVYHHRYYATQEQARKAARALVNFGRTEFGCATVMRQVVDWYVEEDRVAEWADCGEAEYVS